MTSVVPQLRLLLSERILELGLEPCMNLPRTVEGMASFLADPEIVDWLIARSVQTPYINLPGYMDRDWLFNPYKTEDYEDEEPSGRIHHILRCDNDRHKHDHPWDARTIVLRGWYLEERLMEDGTTQEFLRTPGDTATLRFGEYHRITQVSEGGVWTLFITWKYQGTWGFLVDGKKVPYKTYLGLD